MNDTNQIRTLPRKDWPILLHEMPDPPKTLCVRGSLPWADRKILCVVGSRKCSAYGKDVCERLIAGLAGYPVVIVSGLALGIDGVAHEAALRAGLATVAVPGSGLDERVLYPRTHLGLARRLVEQGGALLSEFDPLFAATDWSFPQRNRVMAGMSHAVLVIEAGEKSGTLITARLGMEYNRDVLVVPGPAFSSFSAGSNALLRQGAQAVFESRHLLETLGISVVERAKTHERNDFTDDERALLSFLDEPRTRDALIRDSGMRADRVLILLSSLEIKGGVVERLGKLERLSD